MSRFIKIFTSGLFVFILILWGITHSKTILAAASNIYQCGWDTVNQKCKTTLDDCAKNFEPKDPDFGDRCEDYSDFSTCPGGQSFCLCTPRTSWCKESSDNRIVSTCLDNRQETSEQDCAKGNNPYCLEQGSGRATCVSCLDYCQVTGQNCNDLCGSNGDGDGSGSDGVSVPTSSVVNINDVLDNLLEGVFGFNFNSTNATLGNILTRLIYYVFGLTGIGLLFFLIIGGFKYLTSAGDPKKVESAKGTLTTTIIGFVIVFVAYWLTQIVNYIFKLGGPF